MISNIELSDEDNLLRRACLDPNWLKDDDTLTSLAYKLRKSKGETSISVDLERLTDYNKSVVDPDKYCLFSIEVRAVRVLGLDCEHTPKPENSAHCDIQGNFTNSVSSKLARASKRYFPK